MQYTRGMRLTGKSVREDNRNAIEITNKMKVEWMSNEERESWQVRD